MRYSSKSGVFSYLLMGIGILMIVSCLFREKIASKDDLGAITTKLSGFGLRTIKINTLHFSSRYRNPYFVRYRTSYFVHSKSYNNDFEIMGKIGRDFDMENFEKDIHVGDSITMLVPKSDFNKIGTKTVIRIFGISTNKNTYMNYNNCIDEYNNKGGFIILGIILLIVGYFLMQRAKNKEDLNRLAFQQEINEE